MVRLVLGCAAVVLAACSSADDPAAEGQGWVRRPQPRFVQPSASQPSIEHVRTLALPEDPATWDADHEGIGSKLIEGQRALTFTGEGQWSVRVPGDFEVQTFNRVVVRGTFPGVHVMQLAFGPGEGHDLGAKALYTPKTPDDHTFVFDLHGVAAQREAFDGMWIRVASQQADVAIHEIILLYTPPQLRLAAPGGPAASVNAGTESRMGWCLAHGAPLEIELDVQGPGERLALAIAQEERFRLTGRDAKVSITLQDGRGKETRMEAFLNDGEAGDRSWFETSYYLHGFVGERVTVRFELHVTGERPAAVALADIRHTRRGHAPKTVVLITSDTHRGDHVGHAGMGVTVDTPAIDALAQRGTSFVRGWTSTNITSPSHAALFTGVHPRDSKLLSNGARLADEAETLAELYRAAGYRTVAALSVRHLGPRATAVAQGFDQVYAPSAKPGPASVAVEHALDWIDEAEGQPLFVWLHVFDAHIPYDPPADIAARYWPVDQDPFDPALPQVVAQPGTMPKELALVRNLDWPRAQYKAEVSYLDSQLARVLDLPRVQQGLVAFTSDHGEIFEKDGTFFNHGALFPDTLHVPLVIAGGEIPVGRRVEARVNQIDLGRTLLDMSGLVSTRFPGQNLLFVLDDEAAAAERPLFAMCAHGAAASVTQGAYHMVLNLKDHHEPLRRKRAALELELYDLALDPDCLTNVWERDLDRTRGLLESLVQWLTTKDSEPLFERRQRSREENDQLIALGYAGDDAPIPTHGWLPAGTRPETILERQ